MNRTPDQKSETETQPPRHWVNYAELDPAYWTDEKVKEQRGQEFLHKPIETIANIDASDNAGIARRDFMQIMGASMAMATVACAKKPEDNILARKPVHKILSYVNKPEEITLGVPNYYASTSSATGSGLLVKTREGRPIKIEGNPEHPINRGKLSAREQAMILDLYDPERLMAPVSKNRGADHGTDISYKELDAKISQALKSASAKSKKVGLLMGSNMSPSAKRLIQEFSQSTNAVVASYEPLYAEDVLKGQEESYGTAVIPQYHFQKADVVVSLGADFLGTWISPVEYAADWSQRRKLDSAHAKNADLSKLYVFESIFSITGGAADERISVRAGDEYKVAMALLHELLISKKVSKFASESTVTQVVSTYQPESVAQDLGIAGGAVKLREVAGALWSARGKSLVVGGGINTRSASGLSLQRAINLLNTVLENEGVTVDGTATPRLPIVQGVGSVERLALDMKSGNVDVLFIVGCNPSYNLPAWVGIEEGLKRVPMVVGILDRLDETAKECNFVVPLAHDLENWGDAQIRKGLLSLQQPVITPLFESRSYQDCLINWTRAAGLARGLISTAPDWHEYLKANWKESIYPGVKTGTAFESFWESALRDGVIHEKSAKESSRARAFATGTFLQIQKFQNSPSDVTLAFYEKVGMGDGRQSNNAWIQEMPEPISTITWDNYLNVSKQLFDSMGLREGNIIEVAMGTQKFELPVHLQPGMPAQSVSVAVGYGRTAAGKVGNGIGTNVFRLVESRQGLPVFSGFAVSLRDTGKFYKLAETQWHHRSENRPIINDITLAEYRANPAAANHTDPHLRLETPSMWPIHEYKGYRWGMAIDLNACTGCGACIIACQSENNIPVVGRDNVRNSREMHWIRLDRYYSGSDEQPHVVFQPMMCQHCENAPCETVCPVLATVHSSEGLNDMTYNRCVGTRYCQNNCPYKVRRFNFFDHWKNYDKTLNMAWNPEVTVRSRGIMEKCTFCTQRIRDSKDKAKDLGLRVQDADLQTACQQTCPTNAITFGDMNNPASEVSRQKRDQRAFRALEVLNVKPAIDYLTKVRNVEGGHGHEKKSEGHH